ncbi:Golgi-associated RAB2 interactor protein 4-like [Hemicordylus capensis]|uniref:Golgi-associated RAB2 interactor protein 4-like n=1 Tax=Hemicordylus capensis TaxID=884348 RepID=UPI002304C200|nr:Golgi-associated RAB2 interactor protein 4-like [Hemicordylus capensis]XP_053118162.1 Golgi-associated RAB2 interactor protein 4-like [Hemicordylus capensis]XP_053118163.1 Golgi-associated RAB2 interactor protein 4-like [Hemicordylus capensis]XP_053118164.1 Golgi-associated RAB2 interactor protein 4-like [Hemicordylus capensis]XP_053118165.1 Golgi-associated RAB2 interactor protein 4-like [Hemicordylus capensis]
MSSLMARHVGLGRGKMLNPKLSSFSGGGDYGKGLFDREIGPLQSQLRLGEYDLLKLAPMLESDFVQVSKRGEVIDVHNQVQTVTVGVACTSSALQIPNVLLLARPIFAPEETSPKLKPLLRHHTAPKSFELTRLLPLHFVKISIHNAERRQLRFKLASGRTFYLQLCPQPGLQEDVFLLWVKVVHMLRPPSETISESEEKLKDPGGHGEAVTQGPQSLASFNSEDKVSIHSVYSASEAFSEARDRHDMASSFGSPATSRPPSHSLLLSPSPATSEERESEIASSSLLVDVRLEQPLERPPSRRSHGSEKKEAGEPSSSRVNNKSSRASRSKSSRRASGRKPSKIVSLIRSCSWGSRKKGSKSRSKGKKR